MIRNQMQFVARHRAALALLLMLTAGMGPAQAQAPAGGGGPNEGITVHGHWEIEVRNPDGSLVMRREFENELALQGQFYLQSALLGQVVPGRWAIVASTACGATGGDDCVMVPNGSSNDARLFQTLTVAPANPSNILLSGSFTAQAMGSIQIVSTYISNCRVLAGPVACAPEFQLVLGQVLGGGQRLGLGTTDLANQPLSQFTHTSIQPVALLAGQIVQIRVTLSFS